MHRFLAGPLASIKLYNHLISNKLKRIKDESEKLKGFIIKEL